ncbi:MAG: phage GP46 family protein [Pseudomonadota bacterium]
MTIIRQDSVIVINGVETPLLAVSNPLERAVVISLFTWRRAAADDAYDGDDPMGYWGDTWPTVMNDRIGSRLWLLSRAKITAQVLEAARGYAIEALSWMQEDGVVNSLSCQAQRYGIDAAALVVSLTRKDGSDLTLRFNDLWRMIRNG